MYMLSLIMRFTLGSQTSAAVPEAEAVTRIGPDQYRLRSNGHIIKTVGCTVTASQLPIRIYHTPHHSDPRISGNWLRFLGEGVACQIKK